MSDFRRTFGLPAPNLNIIYNGTNPFRLATQGDEEESDLDVEWSGAIAKGATIDLVVSASTNSSAGVDLSAEYIVDNNVAPIMSESYGACELDLGTAGNQFYNNLWQQAAAEGISVFVATGDSGSAACDRNSAVAANGLSVNGISSTPYNVAVGGTDFNDLQNPSAYWNSTNDPVTQASAKSYIPEAAWNDSCANSEFFQFTGSVNAEGDCNDSSSQFWPLFLVPVGGSGGASNCTVSTNQSVSSCATGYAKPSWQAGSGVPNDGKRDLPDVSLFAGDGLNASFYLVCETDIYGGCPAGLVPSFVGVGGTSASAPTLAGIMAMVNQKMQSRQGNVNYVFYPLAAQSGASCNSTSSVGSSCIFYDVTTGTIAMPCVTGSPNCVTNVAGDQNGVLSGYSTTVSYDLATGLGSVNAAMIICRRPFRTLPSLPSNIQTFKRATFKRSFPAARPAIPLQICTFAFNNFQDAPPATPFFSEFCIVARGWHGSYFPFSLFHFPSPLTPLECALMSKHRVLPGFGRSCPQATPLESALTEISSANPLECALTKKQGGGDRYG